MKYRSAAPSPQLPRRTLDYLERGAAEGRRNAELFDAACQFRDAGIAPGEAEERLMARALADGLTENEARTTMRSALAQGARAAIHHGGVANPPQHHAPQIKPELRPKFIPEPMDLPPPVEGGFMRLLETCFRADEFVAIAPASEDDDGNIVPKRGVTLTAADWRKRVESKGGIERCFSTKLGLFIRLNPMIKNGAKNDEVTAFRHVLVEFDRDIKGELIPKEVQFGAIVSSGFPVSVVIDSGNKSLHAWVRVDAPDTNEYRRRVGIIWDWLEGLSLDKQNKNPSRLSRCPDGWRTVDGEPRQQRLLAVNIGAKSWAEWESANSADGLPEILSGSEFMAVPQLEPPQLIEGVLHQSSKMILGGASKSRKTWTLIDICLSVSAGTPWWGFKTKRGRVLYLNFELPAFAFQKRVALIAAAKGVTDFSGFDLWNLRGFATDFSELIPKILSRIKESNYALIVLDPVYKGLGKRDENKAGDIASLCNEIEQLAVKSGAAVAYGAHYSKGNQAAKDSIDRIGGSGVFARDADVILTMTPHEDKDAYVIDLTLRALPQVDPFVVRWQSVMFSRDSAADASRIRQPGKSAKEPSKGTYRRGSVAERYGVLFESMEPIEHHAPDEQSPLLLHISETITKVGGTCDFANARRIFDSLRHRSCSILVFRNERWFGCKYGVPGGEL